MLFLQWKARNYSHRRVYVLIIYTAAIATTVLGANCAKENQLADNRISYLFTWQELKRVSICPEYIETHFLCRFISAQEETRALTQLIPPHNWPQELLSLSKSAVACCNCYWRSLALVPLPEKVVVVMKASFLYKGIQSSRTSGVFSTTNALLPFTAVSCSDMGQMCPSSACSHALQAWDCNLSDRASKKQQQVPDMRRKVMSRSTPAV